MRKLHVALVLCMFAIGLTLSGCAGGPMNVVGYNDSDSDGIVDYDDKCPKTRYCCAVDEYGCAIDADGDGVCEPYWDKCPGTPKGCKVDERGCSTDSDEDGVCDGLDRCPDTPKGCKVDQSGCRIDSDGDGVCDDLDKCPGTPKGCKVDERGCSTDSDEDGVCDSLDRCPNTPKTFKVDDNGCPIPVNKELIIEFDFDKSDIRGMYENRLKEMAGFVVGHQGSKIIIEAYTDAKGAAGYNQALSERRAEATSKFFSSQGVSTSNMEVRGLGEAWPVGDNGTDAGRQKNRRANCKVINAFLKK